MPLHLGIKDSSTESTVKVELKSGTLALEHKTRKDTHYVLADDILDDEDAILATTGVPGMYSIQSGCVVTDLNPSVSSTIIHPTTGLLTQLWEVEVSYDSNVPPDINQPITSQTPKVRWYPEAEEEVLEKDAITNEPITTACDEPIIIEHQYYQIIQEIRRYEAYPFDQLLQYTYGNHVNETEFWGAPPGCALLLPMEVEEEAINQQRFCIVTYKVKYKIRFDDNGDMLEDTHKAAPLHQGNLYFPKLDIALSPLGVPKRFLDKDGNPGTVNLDIFGVPLPPGQPPQYLSFNRFPKADINLLNLGPF